MKVINLTKFTQQVDVRHADGKLDGVRISPRSRVDLRDGMTVDVRWEQLNPDVVKTVAETIAAEVPASKPTFVKNVQPDPLEE